MCISFWFCASLYFGTGGYNYITIRNELSKVETTNDTVRVVYRGITFSNKSYLDIYLEEQANSSLYPLINTLPTSMLILITVFSFGILGSVTNLIKQIAIDGKKIEELKYISEPLLGMLTGLIIIGLSYLIPNTLAINDIELKPMSLLFLSLFSGYFSIRFYLFLAKVFDKLFKE